MWFSDDGCETQAAYSLENHPVGTVLAHRSAYEALEVDGFDTVSSLNIYSHSKLS